MKINPYSLIHPDNYSGEILDFVKSIELKKPNIAPSDSYSKKNLETIKEHSWMKSCKFTLVSKKKVENTFGTEVAVFGSLREFLESLQGTFAILDSTIIPALKDAKLRLLAMDTETTGLDTRISFVGGKRLVGDTIVGISLATSDTEGYYIPVLHTEEDGIPNWSVEEVRDFLNYIMANDFFTVWHNYHYDMSILMNFGVSPNKTFCDSLLLNKMMGNSEFFELLMSSGLKKLSERMLDRKMLEIHELLGEKENIMFERLPAVNATTYAGSDATNTFGLFKLFVLNDKFKRNPYSQQKLITDIIMRFIPATISMLNSGLPVIADMAKKSCLTTIRRRILLQEQFAKLMGDDVLNSNEKVGIIIGNIVFNNWKRSYEEFVIFMKDTFEMKVSKVTLKSGVVKTKFGIPDKVLENLVANISKVDFLSSEDSRQVKLIVDMSQLYRALTHEFTLYLSLIRCLKRDDRGYAFVNHGLQILGTDTGRYSNASSKAPPKGDKRVVVHKTKKGKLSGKYVAGSGTVPSINAQGISARPYNLVKTLRLTKIPESLTARFQELDAKVNVIYNDELLAL